MKVATPTRVTVSLSTKFVLEYAERYIYEGGPQDNASEWVEVSSTKTTTTLDLSVSRAIHALEFAKWRTNDWHDGYSGSEFRGIVAGAKSAVTRLETALAKVGA
jgi:hypothetical protein